MAQEALPPGYGVRMSGNVELMNETAREFLQVIMLAAVLTYLLIAAIMESWTRPFLIMFTVPLGFLGMYATLWLTGMSMSMMGLLGGVMMIGIVVNNAILIMDECAVLVNSGMVLREAWNMVGENGSGAFYELMRKTSENMKNGYSDMDAIFLFGKSTNSTEIKKFTSALIQSMEKGGSELSAFLARQSSELWNAKKQRMLQSGEKAAGKLLMPIVLIFLGIIIIVMTAAFAGSLF